MSFSFYQVRRPAAARRRMGGVGGDGCGGGYGGRRMSFIGG